jgi:hypothetical protein
MEAFRLDIFEMQLRLQACIARFAQRLEKGRAVNPTMQ